MNAETKELVWQRAGNRCEYCQRRSTPAGVEFHIEHVYPKKHGGSDEPQNLGLSCPECNWAKGTNLSGLIDEKIVPLFHPRRQALNRHYYWDGPVLIGKTRAGKATVYVLDSNNLARVRLRRILIDEPRLLR